MVQIADRLLQTGNIVPVVNAGSNYTIPKSTPFVLTGSATDGNGDALTYSWEQMDVGPAGNWNAPTGNAPLFRSFPPVAIPERYFPKLSDQIIILQPSVKSYPLMTLNGIQIDRTR
jgi:hypothetical protein